MRPDQASLLRPKEGYAGQAGVPPKADRGQEQKAAG